MEELKSRPIAACMEAWLHCENLLVCLGYKNFSFSHHTVQIVNECAEVCLGTIELLKTASTNAYQAALLCFGICEECAEVCDRYDGKDFQNCAFACRQCSSAIAPLASSAV